MTQALVLPEKCSVLNETDEAKFLLDKDFFSSIIPHMDIWIKRTQSILFLAHSILVHPSYYQAV